MKGYFGLLILFGAMKKSDVEINEIWSPESIHHLSHATYTMSRNLFQQIFSCICFDDYNI